MNFKNSIVRRRSKHLPVISPVAVVQRREQVRGAVAYVVVGALLGLAEVERQDGLRPVQGLDLGSSRRSRAGDGDLGRTGSNAVAIGRSGRGRNVVLAVGVARYWGGLIGRLVGGAGLCGCASFTAFDYIVSATRHAPRTGGVFLAALAMLGVALLMGLLVCRPRRAFESGDRPQRGGLWIIMTTDQPPYRSGTSGRRSAVGRGRHSPSMRVGLVSA